VCDGSRVHIVFSIHRLGNTKKYGRRRVVAARGPFGPRNNGIEPNWTVDRLEIFISPRVVKRVVHEML